MLCPHCQKQNRPGLLLCEHCGHQLITMKDFSRYQTREFRPAPETAAPPTNVAPGTGLLHQSSTVTLDLFDAGKKLNLKTEGHLILGRSDKDAQWQPTVDLTPFGAVEKGVSRIHADLYFESDQVFVLELGSANGTRLNGIALRIGSAQRLFSGDLLEMGRLRMRIYFGSEPGAMTHRVSD